MSPGGSEARSRWPVAGWTFLVGGSLAVVAVLWWQLPFANGPQEWEWPYRAAPLHAGWLAPLLGALALCGFVLLPRGSAWLRLGVLTLLGFTLTVAVVGAQPGGMERVIRSLVSRHVFSYVFDAGQFATVAEVVEAYPEGVRELSMHTRTHPPGPLIAIRLLDRLVPAGNDDAGGWVAVARAALDEETRKVRVRRLPVPQHLPSATTVVVLAFLLPAAATLVALPLFLLARSRRLDDRVALLAAALWLSVPARTLFTPSIDQALPLVVLLAAWLAGRPDRFSPLAGGALWGGATLVSYGCLAAAPLVLWCALRPASVSTLRARGRLDRSLVMGVGFLLPWIALALLGFAPLAAFAAAMAEHRSMVGIDRAYTTWLGFNLWDLVLFLGAPVLGLAGADLVEGHAARLPGASQGEGLAPVWWAVLAVLLLSGTVRGEAGRIWLFFMPFAALFAARALARHDPTLRAAVLALQCVILLSLALNLVVVS
jgi:hypothetical protein